MNISARDRGLIAALAAIAAAAAFFVLVITPQHKQAARIQRSIGATRVKLIAAQAAYANGESARKQLILSGDEYTAAHRAVPEYTDVPGMLRLLQRTSAAANVKMNSISFGGSGSSTSSTATTTTASPATSSSVNGANTVSVALSFDGGYGALKRLVHRLDSFVSVSHGRLTATGPLVGISDISLADGSNTSSGANQLSVTLTVTIYQYGSPSSVTGSGGSS